MRAEDEKFFPPASEAGDAEVSSKVSNGLPEELVWEIVAKLPVEQILRARCVCSSWRDIIRNPLFISKHRQAIERNETGAETKLLLATSDAGTLLLNRQRHDSWAISPFFACPTHPAGVLVGAAGGLLCFNTLENFEDLQLNFVVWNPITKESLRIPPLHVREDHMNAFPSVFMVVRGGRLRMLMVDMIVCFCVYDLFISKESMEKRIANSGRLIYPLPNLWMEFFAAEGSVQLPVHPGGSELVCSGDLEVLVDLDTFRISPATRVPPAEIAANESMWFMDPISLSRDSTDRKLRVLWLPCERTLDYIILCDLTITRDAGGVIFRHDALCKLKINVPRSQGALPRVDIAGLPGEGNEVLVTDLHSKVRPGRDEFEVRRETLLDRTMPNPYRSYSLETFVFSNVGGGDGVAPLVEHEHERSFSAPVWVNLPAFLFLEPSLVDSPGRLPQGEFSWEMVQFPEEIRELPSRWDDPPF